MTDLKSLLLPNEKQQSELELFLTSHFGGSSQIEPNKIRHGERLTVEYNRNNSRIKAIYLTDDSLKDDLISKAKDALATNYGTQVQSFYVHSLKKVTGYFRYANDFQILPALPSAPQPDVLFADHSFIIEYRFEKSTHSHINIHRASKRAREIKLLLNSLLISGLSLPHRSSTYEWVLEIIDGELKSKYLNLGYYGGIDTREKDKDGFTSVKDYSPISTISAGAYYTIRGITIGEINDLTLPDTFQNSILAFEKLNDANKELFLRASYWTHVAHKTFTISHSAAYSALVTSIEVFLPNPKERCVECNRPTSAESCSSCHQPIAGPTKQFRDFVEKYAPGTPEAIRKKLYEVRSSITHGGALMPDDENETGFEFTSKNNEARNNWDWLVNLVQIVQINWLHLQ